MTPAVATSTRGPLAWLVLALVVVGVGVGLSPVGLCACATGPMRARLKNDLRSLATAQEGFRADSQRYSAAVERLEFRYDPMISITIDTATDRGYRARASYLDPSQAKPAGSCVLWGGDSAFAVATVPEWEPRCWIPRPPLWRFGGYRSPRELK